MFIQQHSIHRTAHCETQTDKNAFTDNLYLEVIFCTACCTTTRCIISKMLNLSLLTSEFCHNPSPSPKSKVQSPKSKGLGVTLFCCATTTISPPVPHHISACAHTNFSQQPDTQMSSNFHSRLTWQRLNDFRTNQEPCPPQIQLLTWRTE